MAGIDPTYSPAMPARNVVCSRCGALVPELDDALARHTAWHREPEAIPPDPVVRPGDPFTPIP